MTDGPVWLEEGAPFVWRPYQAMLGGAPPLAVARTEGVRLVLDDGRALIDGIASWWTACHGYNHPHILSAIQAQAARMPHVMFGGLAHEGAYRLAARLARMLPGELNHVFFADSGSVAVEISMKMAVQFWLNRGVSGRSQFLSFRGGYHGDTLATMSVSDPDEGMHSLFRSVFPDQVLADLPMNDASEVMLDGILTDWGPRIAAILVEPLIQGAGGMIFHDAVVLKRLRRLADKHDVLLIFDEIFTGFGRTGTLFAMEAAGIEPDIVTLSKALTGGTLPLSCAVANERVFSAFFSADPSKALMHGPTFMANPLACAAANASLDLFETGEWQRNVARIERGLRLGLEPCLALSDVVDVRVRGAVGVVAFETSVDVQGLTRQFAKRGCWIRPMGKVVYLTPPLVIGDEDLAWLTGVVAQTLGHGR